MTRCLTGLFRVDEQFFILIFLLSYSSMFCHSLSYDRRTALSVEDQKLEMNTRNVFLTTQNHWLGRLPSQHCVEYPIYNSLTPRLFFYP